MAPQQLGVGVASKLGLCPGPADLSITRVVVQGVLVQCGEGAGGNRTHGVLHLLLKEKELEVERPGLGGPQPRPSRPVRQGRHISAKWLSTFNMHTSGGPQGSRAHTTTRPGQANHTGRNAHNSTALPPRKSLHTPSTRRKTLVSHSGGALRYRGCSLARRHICPVDVTLTHCTEVDSQMP